MDRFRTPSTYFIGTTEINEEEIARYLRDTGQLAFLTVMETAFAAGVKPAEALCSFYAKLCYAALTTEKNDNITRVREIAENIEATLAHGHGSVFEHVQLNFVTTNCSRVFTHELVRHRVGTSFSQTSGRYVRATPIGLVLDPILEPVKDIFEEALKDLELQYLKASAKMFEGVTDFGQKKKITSALRRMLPNGQTNEMGWSANIRSMRHMLMMRTSRFAEWEIRLVFGEVYELVKKKFPLLFSDAKVEIVDDMPEITGMVTQPY